MRDGHNGYTPASGIMPAREAVAAEYSSLGVPLSPDRVLLTSGTSEGIDLAISVLVDRGDEVLVPLPTYPFYTAVIGKLGARAVFYRTDPERGWEPDLDHLRSKIGPRTRALVVIDPNNPTGAVYGDATRRTLLELADRHNIVLLADEVYTDLVYDGPVPPIASFDPDAPVISFSSASKAYVAPGWRTGWMAVGAGERLDKVLAAVKRLADGRLCTNGPMQHAVAAALAGDRSYQHEFRRQLGERAALTARRLNAIDGVRCVPPAAAFYALPRFELPARAHRLRLRQRAAAGNGHPVRTRLRLRHGPLGRLRPHHLPCRAGPAGHVLRPDRSIHRGVPFGVRRADEEAPARPGHMLPALAGGCGAAGGDDRRVRSADRRAADFRRDVQPAALHGAAGARGRRGGGAGVRQPGVVRRRHAGSRAGALRGARR